jgi:uncharacterized protein YlxP (DUF503 family)
MYYGVARLELLVAQSRSLKEKRAVLHRIRDRLESRFKVSVSEVDHQDLWQRSAVGVALVAHSESSARNALQAVRREIELDPRVCVSDFAVIVQRFDAEDADGSALWDGSRESGDVEEQDSGGES